MYEYVSVAAALALGGMVVCGVMAAATGWMLPWLRHRTLRPAMWGYGTVLFGGGLLLSMSYATLGVFDGYPALVDAAFIANMVMIVAGGYLQVLSTRERVDG